MRSTRVWLRLARRLFPDRVWSGAGIVVRKVHLDAYTGDARANTGVAVAYGSGMISARWVLVVKDDTDREHYVNVDPSVWESHGEGDVVTADDPLVNLR
jgi:hypothetical protein